MSAINAGRVTPRESIKRVQKGEEKKEENLKRGDTLGLAGWFDVFWRLTWTNFAVLGKFGGCFGMRRSRLIKNGCEKVESSS